MMKPKGGLGRGLGSLISSSPFTAPSSVPAIDVAAEGSMRVVDVHPDQILENPYQPRRVFAPEELAELAASIKEHGILQPLVVTRRSEGGYELIAGERRLRAARSIGLETVPVIVREADEKRKLELAIIENIQRADLNAIEEARAYKSLIEEFGLTQDEVAKQMGKSRPTVANAMRLLDLPDEMRRALEEGKISKSHARTLLGEADPGRRRALFAEMLAGTVTVRQAEHRVVSPHTRRTVNRDPNLAAIETELREKIGTKVEIVMDDNAHGTVTIHFYSKEDLRAIIDHLK